MKIKRYINQNAVITFVVALIFICVFVILGQIRLGRNLSERIITAGFIYDGDESTPYTYNFIRTQNDIEKEFGEKIRVLVKTNVPESEVGSCIQELIDSGCNLIFLNSYGFQFKAKEFAAMYPNVQFCQATGDNSLDEPLKNYHTFMGEIYQGRYISGIVAGMKLQELLKNGVITPSEAKLGYVAAFPYAEVISGFTAFLLGVRSVVPFATMNVRYVNTWNNYSLERDCTLKLIEDGCVIISQHSDSIAPAVVCEEAHSEKVVFHVGYNQSMINIAPTTSLISSKINWFPYMEAAVKAVMRNYPIEKGLKVHVNGNDSGAGFENNWVQMLDLNRTIAAEGTLKKITEVESAFKKGKVHVFFGDYTGKNPFNEQDVCNLNEEFKENETRSAPSFCYILDDVVNCVQ